MKRKTLEEIKRELSIIHPNLTILSNEYVARRHPMSFRCNVCGHEWVKHWDLVSRTNGCPKCSISQLAEKLSLCQQKESIGFKYPELIKYFKDVLGVVYLTTALVLPIPLYLSQKMKDGWTKFCITSIVFECIAFLVVYLIGLNSREKELLKKKNRRQNKLHHFN